MCTKNIRWVKETIVYEHCDEEEERTLNAAYKYHKFKKKRKKRLIQKERKRFLKLLIDFCRRAEEFLENTSPQFIATLALHLIDCPKKNIEDGYLVDKELSREIQRIIREEREE